MAERFDAPNFTQIPNVLFDTWLTEIEDDLELRVVLLVARFTFGWRTDNMQLSLKELASRARKKMTVPELLKGLTLALDHGYVERKQEPNLPASFFRIPVDGRCTNRFTAKDALDPSDVLSMPSRPGTKAPKRVAKPKAKRSTAKCDTEYIAQLQAEELYSHVNVKQEYMKMFQWCKANRREPTRARLVNWLNKNLPLNGDAVDETYRQDSGRGYEKAAERTARLFRERHGSKGTPGAAQ
jgi:hypothetical protein